MMYTSEEKQKIYSNIDKIIAYLLDQRVNVRGKITIDFGPMQTYAGYERETAYHLTIEPYALYGRTGGLHITFEHEDTMSSSWASIYRRIDYAVALIQNWQTIKREIHKEIANQNNIINAINNFEI